MLKEQYGKTPTFKIVLLTIYGGLADIYEQSGVYDLAVENLTRIIDLDISPLHNSLAHLKRGKIDLDMDNIVQALEDTLLAANSPDPDTQSRAYVNLGKIYSRQGLYDTAKEKLIESIKLNPRIPESYYNMGVLIETSGDKERAKKLFQTAININANYAEAKFALEQLDRTKIRTEDWLSWWNKNNFRRGLGITIALGIAFTLLRPFSNALSNTNTPTSTFGIAAVFVGLLLLPFIQKLKAGPIALEMKSTDKEISTANKSLNLLMSSV